MNKRIFFGVLSILLLGVFVGCSKKEESLTPLKVKPSDYIIGIKYLGFDNTVIQWEASVMADKSKVVYDIFLNDEQKGKDMEVTNYEFQGLACATDYKVRVVAKSIYGTELERSFLFTTKEAPTPTGITLKQDRVSAQEIAVSWEKTDEKESLIYDVYLSGELKASALKECNYLFQGLQPKQSYIIKVVARNKYDKTLDVVITVTTEDYPLPEDFTITMGDVTESGAAISWSGSTSQELSYDVLLNGEFRATNQNKLSHVFIGLTSSQEYHVTVTAKNKYGKELSRELVFNTKEPEAPASFDVFVEEVTYESARIRWVTQGDNNESISYRVFVNGFFRGEAKQDNSLVVKGLEPEKEYLLKVEARNSAQKKTEKQIKFSTKAAPYLKNFDLTVDLIKPTSALLSWDECVATDGSKVVYDIYYSNGVRFVKGVEEREYLIENLKQGTHYNYSVKARSETIIAQLSRSIDFTTQSYETPEDFQVNSSMVTSHGVHLQWTGSKLSSGGEIVYNVYLGEALYARDVKGNNIDLTNLSPSTEYKVKVEAQSSHNISKVVSIQFVTKAAVAPKVVIDVIKVNQRNIEINWHITGTEKCDNYQLFLDGKLLGQGYFLGKYIDKLNSNTAYRIKVVAQKGDSFYEKEIEVRTKEYDPVVDFNMLIAKKSYNRVELDISDFYSKNSDRYDDFNDMTYQVYLNGVKGNWEDGIMKGLFENLSEKTHYELRLIIKHSDGSIAVDRISEFTTDENIAPVWSKTPIVKRVGFGFVEIDCDPAVNSDDNTGLEYGYFINGVALKTNTSYVGNARGNGMVEHKINDNHDPILISHLESHKSYSFYMEAKDAGGKISRSEAVEFRTTVDAFEKFDVMAVDAPAVKHIGPRWKRMGNLSSIKSIRILWNVDDLQLDDYLGGSQKIIADGDYDTLLLDYSPFLQKNPNASISFRVAIEWIDQEPLKRSISNVIIVR